MLSDEEKKALYMISLRRKGIPPNGGFIADNEEITIILNLIEKQSKEIEELKEKNKLLEENYSSAHEDINWFCENHISKKESEQKEKEAYIKGTNDAHELCNKKWKDKIKAKIEEQEKIINTGGIDFNTKSYARCKKEFGQSLLDKE